jgi:hypothetical protein
MAKVKYSFIWRRACSALPPPLALVEVPAGAAVHKQGSEWYVSPSVFDDDIVKHDATYYGCRVAPDNVTEE